MPDVPRIRVAALVALDARLLLVRHSKGGRDYHLLPGGGVEGVETLAEALVREVREETGLEIAVGRPILLSDTVAPDGSRRVVNVVFDCETTGGALTDAPEDDRVTGVDLVEPGQLSELDLRPPMAGALLEHLADPATECRYLGALWRPEPENAV